MRVLIAGWFSFERMGATAGDLISRDLVRRWLANASIPFDVALAHPFEGGVDWRQIQSSDYTHVVFVCGPFGNGPPITEFLPRFAGCRMIGLNLSMLESLDVWNPFDVLLERDSSSGARPDLTFLAEPSRVPVVGIVLVHPQEEYGKRARHREGHHAVRRLTASREMSCVDIDTRLDENGTGLRSPAEVESLVARMDAVVTTRLHGMVLALKNGVPPLAIDPVAGGAKIARQARTLGWPVVFTADRLADRDLRDALDYCLSPEARMEALARASRARELIQDVPRLLIEALGDVEAAADCGSDGRADSGEAVRNRAEFSGPHTRP